ncbi:MAG: hypothetical protein ACRDRB_24115, partial [Pseudonocardiaceae bacterium]
HAKPVFGSAFGACGTGRRLPVTDRAGLRRWLDCRLSRRWLDCRLSRRWLDCRLSRRWEVGREARVAAVHNVASTR